jgi:hypothetical protein
MFERPVTGLSTIVAQRTVRKGGALGASAESTLQPLVGIVTFVSKLFNATDLCSMPRGSPGCVLAPLGVRPSFAAPDDPDRMLAHVTSNVTNAATKTRLGSSFAQIDLIFMIVLLSLRDPYCKVAAKVFNIGSISSQRFLTAALVPKIDTVTPALRLRCQVEC